MPGAVVGKGSLWPGSSQTGAPYQSLPTVETKPKSKCSCMWNPLPNLTSIRARGAKPLGGFGLEAVPLPMLTNHVIWLHRRPRAPLPIITGRGVKYTHNDIKHTVLHTDSGPRGIRLIPQASNQKEIVPPHPHDPQSIQGHGPAILTPRPRHRLATTANTVAKQVILVKNS